MRNPFVIAAFCILAAFPKPLMAQTGCGAGLYPKLVKNDPSAIARATRINQQWAASARQPAFSRQDEQVYTLPVVFHIIHKGESENISDAEVMNAFRLLNDAFANSGSFDQGSGIDTKIRFCLAKTDPEGNYTTGITRTYADLLTVNPDVNDAFLKSLINWDPSRYINIWIVKEIDLVFETTTCGSTDLDAAGYATFPSSHGTLQDGIVAEAAFLAAVLPHEMGHYLGLYHTFEGGCGNADCLLSGDQVCDTPPEQTITNPCGKGDNSCNTDALSGFATDQPDLETNFMDYGNDGCRHDFTPGQKDRMRFMIENIRNSLLASGVCENDCAQPAEAEFVFDTRDYATGQTITFTNTSTQAGSYEWYVNSSFAGSSVNLAYTFPIQGWYRIRLLAKPSPDETKCRNVQLAWVRVFCSMRPTIQADKKVTVVNDPVHFSSFVQEIRPVPGSIVYEWYADDVLFGNAAEVDHSFDSPGKKIVYLVVLRGGCRDTSDKIVVDVKPLPDYTIKLNHIICQPSGKRNVSFSVCNNSALPSPAAIPVTFYAANPALVATPPIGATVNTGASIPRFCCRDFEVELPEGFTGDYLYGVINDDHSVTTPYSFATDFPVTSFHESNYTNNIDSLKMDNLEVTIVPGDTVEVVIGSTIAFTAVSNQPASYSWSAASGTLSCTVCTDVVFEPVQFTRVIVTAYSEGGCKATDTVVVKVIADGEIFIPSAFTPNQDGLNDIFYIMGGKSVKQISSFRIFNRWGQQVFARQDIQPNFPSYGWNGNFAGKNSPSAVYVYLVTALFQDGTTKTYKGTLTLIR